MRYDFDKVVDRKNTNSYKWDSANEDGVLPLWVADMDFETAPAITNALSKRVEHGVFGYVKVPDSYYKATIDWFSRRHNWDIERDWFIYTSGVVPAISAIIKAVTKPGDKVVAMTPVYNCFFSSIRNNGCVLLSCPLVSQGDTYVIDFDDLERKVSDPDTKVLLLCNPHNPTGRVWTRDELQRIGDICLRNDVFVISDEIHCELVFKGYKYIPFASVDRRFLSISATCVSPSKAFNIAGLQIANIIAPNEDVRRRIDKAININEVCDVNPFGVVALIAAYNEGEEWLGQLVEYLYDNYCFARQYIESEISCLKVSRLEGTYLLWVDFRSLGKSSEVVEEELLKERKLWLNAGTMYGDEGEGFMRINLACPRVVLEDALTRLKSYVKDKV